jgi:ribosomal protein S18 acetylase RimI-like enzyme
VLDELIAEECAAWDKGVDWDFEPSALLVKEFLRQQAVEGFVCLEQGSAVGWVWHSMTPSVGGMRAVIGGLYAKRGPQAQAAETLLLTRALNELRCDYGVRRVEAQFLHLSQALEEGFVAPTFPDAQSLKVFDRLFLSRPLHDLPGQLPLPIGRLEPWPAGNPALIEGLLRKAYEGHIDSQINQQYTMPGGAAQFLRILRKTPACGLFLEPASWLMRDVASGEPAGFVAASTVKGNVGHVTQLCVLPQHQGRGFGGALLRQSLVAMESMGLTRATLTVTAANAAALQLYRATGFQRIRRYPACVWTFA